MESAEKKVLTARPIKISLVLLIPPLRESADTIRKASIPPAKENTGARKESAGSSAVASTAKNAEPELMPIMPGSASGLRITACSRTPATVMAAPPRMETKIRGKRNSATIATSRSYSMNIPLKRSAKDTEIPPIRVEQIIIKKSNASVTTKITANLIHVLLCFFAFCACFIGHSP